MSVGAAGNTLTQRANESGYSIMNYAYAAASGATEAATEYMLGTTGDIASYQLKVKGVRELFQNALEEGIEEMLGYPIETAADWLFTDAKMVDEWVEKVTGTSMTDKMNLKEWLQAGLEGFAVGGLMGISGLAVNGTGGDYDSTGFDRSIKGYAGSGNTDYFADLTGMEALDERYEQLQDIYGAQGSDPDTRKMKQIRNQYISRVGYTAMKEYMEKNGIDLTAGQKESASGTETQENVVQQYQKEEHHGKILDVIREGLPQIKEMAAVKQLSGNEFQKTEGDKRSLRAKVIDFFNGIGNKVFRPGMGDIELNTAGARDSLAHGYGKMKAATFAALPEVIEKGKIVYSDPNYKNRGYESLIISAPVKVGTETCYVGALIIRDDKTQRYKLHEVLMANENGAPLFQSESGESAGPLRNDAPSGEHLISPDIMIPQGESGVKGNYARAARENTGTAQGQERSAVNAEQNTASAEQIEPETPVKLRSDTDVNLTTYAQDLNAKRAAALRRRVADAEAELASPAELGVVQGETETRNRIVPESIAARDADLQEARAILNGAGYTDTGFVTGQIERYGGTDHYALTKDGKALIQADSVWYTPQELAQTFVQQYGEKKGAKGNGTAVYDTDGGRVRGERAGGETERVAESTDAEAGVSKAERGNGTGNPQTDAGNAKVSAAGLGIKNGTDTGNLKLIVPDADGTYADARVQQAAEFLNQFGIEATFVSGNILVRNPYTRKVQRMLAAVTADGRVVIRADAQKVTPLQLAKHEAFHMLEGENPGMRQQILEKLFEDYEEEEVLVLAHRYVEGYEGIYGTWEDEADRYIDEMLADAYAGINRTFAHAAKYEEPVRSYVEENGMTPGSGEKTEAYSIVSLPDGKKYVQADRQVIHGDDAEKWGEQIETYINEKIRNGEDVLLPTDDGHVLVLTERSAYKLSDRHKSEIESKTKELLSDEEFGLKMRVASQIDEIVRVGKLERHRDDRRNKHKNDIGEDGFNYYNAYFRDFDGSYYRVPVSAALNQDMETAYSIGEIRKREYNRRRGSSSRNGGAQSGALNSPTRIIYTSEENSQGNSEKIPEWKKKLSEYPFSAGEETVEEKQRAAVQEEITARYKKIVHEILSRKKIVHGAVLVGYTPKIYRDLGMPELPFVINGGHVYSIAKTEQEAKAETGRGNHKGEHYHGLGESVVADIMEFVQDPVMIIAAKDVDPQTTPMRSTHSIVALIDVGSGKNSLVIPIAITAERSVDGVRMDVNAISSAYERNTTELVNEAIAQFNIGENSVFYVKKEAESLIGAGMQFPEQLKAAASSDGIVRRFDSKINMSVKKFTESKQFKRWFGDWQNNPGRASKIVNADGTPKGVYHGTDKEFRVFRSKSGLYWFSESRDYAEAMAEERGGDRVEEVYLNIRNPYYAKLEPGKFSDPNYEKALIREAKKRGCDGLIIQNDTDNELEAETFYVAFKPNQIKSATDNVGTFSTETEDIYFSAGEETVEVPEYLTGIEKAPPGRRRRKKDT